MTSVQPAETPKRPAGRPKKSVPIIDVEAEKPAETAVILKETSPCKEQAAEQAVRDGMP